MDIEEILHLLTDDDNDSGDNGGERAESNKGASEGQGLFSGLDPEMLMKMLSLFETLNQPNDSERFLLALKPLLREENRPKIDSAIRLLKLFSLLPMLRDSGLFGG